MIDLGEHAEFIVWGYLGVAIVAVTLVVWVVLDSRKVAARLARLDAQGIRRRSAGQGGSGA